MRPTVVLSILALSMACSGQQPPSQARPAAVAAPVQPPPATAVKRIELNGVAQVESGFEQRLKGLDPIDPFDRLGACSGVYVSGYGLVFTTAVSLVGAPVFGPFTGGFTKEKADAVHKRMLAHLPALRKAMSEMLTGAAKSLNSLPPNEKVVVAVRLFYMDWEDKNGLPNQIVMTADRASAVAGKIETDEQ